MTRTTSFGLPGDVYVARIDYVTVSEGSAPGWRHFGDHIGWAFAAESYADWCASDAFAFLSDSLTAPSSEGQHRAVTGARLLARASREHRTDLKLLGVVQALETWLLPRRGGPQARRFARHVTAFACHRDDGRRCGGDATDCPYLRLNPDDGVRLSTLASLGSGWICSEWDTAMQWYDARNAAVHGRGHDVAQKVASSAEFVTAHYLLEPILTWLAAHPEDPIAALETELDTVVDRDAWDMMLAALDAPDPPETPPTT
jgi:hypothetical protein